MIKDNSIMSDLVDDLQDIEAELEGIENALAMYGATLQNGESLEKVFPPQILGGVIFALERHIMRTHNSIDDIVVTMLREIKRIEQERLVS